MHGTIKICTIAQEIFTSAHVQYLLQAHDRDNQLMQQLVIFLTVSVDVLLRGDANNRTTSFGGATTSNFAS